jgi:hypothetical protein
MGQARAAPAVNRRRLQLKTYPAAPAMLVQSREADYSRVEPPFSKGALYIPNVSSFLIWGTIDKYPRTVAEQQLTGHKSLKINPNLKGIEVLLTTAGSMTWWKAPAAALPDHDPRPERSS